LDDSTRRDGDRSTACKAALQAGIENGAKGLFREENLSRSPDWIVEGFEALRYYVKNINVLNQGN
jgi:hypothetical protein